MQHPTTHPSIVRLEPVHVAAPVLQSAVACAQRAATTQDGQAAREALQLVLEARGCLVDPQPEPAAAAEEVAAWS